MMPRQTYRSCFVPHNLAAPLVGNPAGPLAGLSAVVKDMFDIAGERAGNGNPTWLAQQQPARQNAPLIQTLLDAGATIVGKVISDEFFYSGTGMNVHYGTPLNARAPDRIPGGSSSGSGAAVGAGLCDFALGSDTAGSVRGPACFNGIYGIRPSIGRIDSRGVGMMSPTLDTPGWMAATPGVFRKAGVILKSAAVAAKVSRVVVLEDAFAIADEPVADLLRMWLELTSDRLPAMAHARVAPEGLSAWREVMRTIQAYEAWQIYKDFITNSNPVIAPAIKARFEYAASLTAQAMDDAMTAHARIRKHVRDMATPGTVLALPTVHAIPHRLDASPEEQEEFRFRIVHVTCISSLSGLPQVTIPIGTVGGGPVGLSFIGWYGGDEALLDLAYALAPYCGMAA